MSRTPLALLALLVGLVLGAWAILRSMETMDPPAPAAPAGPAPRLLRIASLSPALTQATVDLGLGEAIVGRTPWCDAVDPEVPVIGDLLAVDYEALLRLAPSHLLIQPTASGIEPALTEAAAREGITLSIHPALDDIADVRRCLRRLAADLDFGDADRAEALADRAAAIEAEIDAALAAPPVSLDGPVLLVHGVDPVGAFGRGTWLDDALRAIGATNAVEAAGWTTLSLEDVARLDPAAVVMIAAPGRAAAEGVALFGPLAELPIRAVREDRLRVVDVPGALLPSTTIPAVVRALHAALAAPAVAP